MSADTTEEQTVWVHAGTRSSVYHTDPDCQAAVHTWREAREVTRSQYPNRTLCRYCEGTHDSGATNGWNNNQCRSCEGSKVEGVCLFCERFDRVHDVDTRVDIHWLRRTAAAGKVLRA